MQLFDEEKAIRAKIFEYFGYKEDWRVLPLDDARSFFWRLNQNEFGRGTVWFADSIDELNTHEGNCYRNLIYTQRHLPKWVYRGEEFTMIVVDTQTDGNQFLQIFTNSKECK